MANARNKKFTPRKVLKNGKVAVLYSPMYGAGWSSWVAKEYKEMLLFDRRFVKAAERGATYEEVCDILTEMFGQHEVFAGGWRYITVAWVNIGDVIQITENDGWEELHVTSPDGVYIA